MRKYTSLTDQKKKQKVPKGLIAIMFIAVSVGLFFTGCSCGMIIKQKIDFHKIHEAEHYPEVAK
jgi:amino acid transporter